MTASTAGVYNLQEFTSLGALGVGMRLYTYTYGTTTHKTAYTDAAGSVAHTYTADGLGGQYLALDARGELPAPLYLTVGSYDLALKDSGGATVWTRRADPTDDVFVDLAASSGAGLVGWIRSAIGAVATTLAKWMGYQPASVFDFMTDEQIADIQAGTHLINIDAAYQAAVTAVCGAGRTLHNPKGTYVFSVPITFPNTSFKLTGEGPTSTAFSSSNISTTQPIFDFTGCNGPLKVIDGIYFGGKIGHGSATSVGVYCDATNGLLLRNTWMAGLSTGIQKTVACSYIKSVDCTFEYNTTAISWVAGVESSIINPVFYRNTYDVVLSGDLDNFIYGPAHHNDTVTTCVLLNGATRGRFFNISARKELATISTPDIVKLTGGSSNNYFDGVSTNGFGRALINLVSTGGNLRNKFLNLSATGLTANAALEIGVSNTFNTFSGKLDSCLFGSVEAAGNNTYLDMEISGNGTGVLLSAASDCTFSRVSFSGNTTDWSTTGGLDTIWLNEVVTNMAGLSPVRAGTKGAGILGRTFYGTAIPTTLAYLFSDRVVNTNPAVGSPKAWTCTVAGTPGTWVSEGNL